MSDVNKCKLNETSVNENVHEKRYYMMRTEDGVFHNADEYLDNAENLLKVEEVHAQVNKEEESEFIEEPLWDVLPNDVPISQFDDYNNNKHKIEKIFSSSPLDITYFMNDQYMAMENKTKIIFDSHIAGASNELKDQFYCLACNVYFHDLQAAQQHDCLNTEATHRNVEEEENQEQIVEKEVIKAYNSSVEYGCEHCGNLFGTYEKFQEHQRKQSTCATGDPLAIKIECGQCGRIFATLNALKSHMRSHYKKQFTKLNLYSCAICKASFRTKRFLDLHGRVHEMPPVRTIEEALPHSMKRDYPQGDQFFCEICDKNFDSNLLLVHKNMHLSDEAITISTTCRICNIEFACQETHDMHMKLHEGSILHKLTKVDGTEQNDHDKYRFKCQFCERTFKRPYEKVNHERVHTGEKPFSCQVCGKRFRTSYSLTVHLRTHTDIRPYECQVCHKSYKSYGTYAHHINTHSSQRNFKCEKCNKCFSTSVQLCGHRKVHSRPFVCKVCKRAFASIVNWRSHMKLKHDNKNEENKHKNSLNDKKATCSICGAMYARSKNLREHMITRHAIENSSQAPSPVGDMNPHELVEMDLMGTHFLAAREEIVTQEYNEQEHEEEKNDNVDEQSALLIAATNATKTTTTNLNYNSDKVKGHKKIIANSSN